MSSGKFQNKNLIFYVKGNEVSNDFLSQLDKNEPLKKQFILIDQNDSKISLPSKVREIGQPLILVACGVNQPLINKDALYWLSNNCFANQSNGLEYHDLRGGASMIGSCGAFLDDHQNNLTSGTSKFSLVAGDGAPGKIDTIDDSGRSAKTSEFDQRLSRLKNERDSMLPKKPMVHF